MVEIASNDGYLPQYFQKRGVPVLGIEPAANVAEVACTKDIPTDIAFFGAATAKRLLAVGIAPNLIAANNVLVHVPDINDFSVASRCCWPRVVSLPSNFLISSA